VAEWIPSKTPTKKKSKSTAVAVTPADHHGWTPKNHA
jgi:hypothetical protein